MDFREGVRPTTFASVDAGERRVAPTYQVTPRLQGKHPRVLWRINKRCDEVNLALHGLVVAFGIKDPVGLKEASNGEIENLPKRYSILPVTGFLQISPVYLSIFRMPLEHDWDMPHLSDSSQVNFECLIRNKDVKFEFLIWQNANLPEFPGEVAISI